MTLTGTLLDSLRKVPGKIISRDAEGEWSADRLLEASRASAGKLLERASGSHIGLLLPTGAAYPAALLGALWAGKVAVPINPMLKSEELAFLFADASIDTVVVTEATAPLIADLDVRSIPVAELLGHAGPSPSAPSEVEPESIAVMLYTSGTSGKPKGVPLSHTNLLSNARALIERTGLDGSEVFLGLLPIFHALGLTGSMIMPLLLGSEVTYLPRFHPERAASTIAERGVSDIIGVPGMYGLLGRARTHEQALKGVRLPVCGGEALPSAYRDAWRNRFGHDLMEGYGLTETSPVLAVNTPTESRPGTVGKPLPGIEVRISGEDGEIQVRGPSVMAGYHNRPEETAAAFSADGWFRTGDMGQLDADGYLSITGRIKELIIRGGEKIMPREVEDVLCQCPGVMEAAVIGEPDGDRGEVVVAFVTPGDSPPTEEQLRAFCRERLAEFKVPRRITVARDLPRGPTGKLLKRALRDCNG